MTDSENLFLLRGGSGKPEFQSKQVAKAFGLESLCACDIFRLRNQQVYQFVHRIRRAAGGFTSRQSLDQLNGGGLLPLSSAKERVHWLLS
jgi:hypothetical protein